MRSVWTVIKREYRTRVRTRWFVLSTLAVPVIFGALLGGQVLMGQRSAERSRTFALVDRTGVLAEALRASLESGGFTVSNVYGGQTDEEALRERVEEGELAGYLVLDDETLARGAAIVRAEERPRTLTRFGLQQAISRAALEVRLGGEQASEEVRSLMGGGELAVELLDGAAGGESERDAGLAIALVGSMILYFVILLYGVAVMRGVIEEKTSRIVEIVISSIRPWQLMLGKLIGVGSVGLTQLGIWLGLVVVMGLFGLPALMTARPELAQVEPIWEVLKGSGALFLFLVFFILGYFMYAALYAAVGAMCSSEEETQQAHLPVTVLIVIPIFLITGVTQSPGSTQSVVLSLFPFFAPVLMFARAALGAATPWQLLLAIVLMIAATLGVIWIAGRIYRVGILMQGKRPTLPELIRWVRQA